MGFNNPLCCVPMSRYQSICVFLSRLRTPDRRSKTTRRDNRIEESSTAAGARIYQRMVVVISRVPLSAARVLCWSMNSARIFTAMVLKLQFKNRMPLFGTLAQHVQCVFLCFHSPEDFCYIVRGFVHFVSFQQCSNRLNDGHLANRINPRIHQGSQSGTTIGTAEVGLSCCELANNREPPLEGVYCGHGLTTAALNEALTVDSSELPPTRARNLTSRKVRGLWRTRPLFQESNKF